MFDIYAYAADLRKKREVFVIVTVIKKEGSAPTGTGTKMIVLKNGKTIGTIGGGCLESIAIEEALQSIKEGKTKTVNYTLKEEENNGIGMRCGGRVELLIEVAQPAPHLVIIGSGHIASFLSKLSSIVGFSTTIIDPLAKNENFPEAEEVISKDVESGISEVNIIPETYFVIATRHKYDFLALKKITDSEATYIGVVSSKNRFEIAAQNLVTEGVSKKLLQKVYAPIGLDIGAETPEEIAISIIAEIIKHRRGGTGKPLSSKRLN